MQWTYQGKIVEEISEEYIGFDPTPIHKQQKIHWQKANKI